MNCIPSIIPYSRDLAADCPLLHTWRFYHTLGHYPGHLTRFELNLVTKSLGGSRNLMMSRPTNCKPLAHFFMRYSKPSSRDNLVTTSPSYKQKGSAKFPRLRSVFQIHLFVPLVGATGGVYKEQGRNRCMLMTCDY